MSHWWAGCSGGGGEAYSRSVEKPNLALHLHCSGRHSSVLFPCFPAMHGAWAPGRSLVTVPGHDPQRGHVHACRYRSRAISVTFRVEWKTSAARVLSSASGTGGCYAGCFTAAVPAAVSDTALAAVQHVLYSVVLLFSAVLCAGHVLLLPCVLLLLLLC